MFTRKADHTDAKDIAALEAAFCQPRGLPPEDEDGVHWFLLMGGNIHMYCTSERIHSAFWSISVEALRTASPNKLSDNSPMRKLINHSVFRELNAKDRLVFSWTPVGPMAKWLYRMVKDEIESKPYSAIGFVDCQNSHAIQNYLRMGCVVVGYLPKLYRDDDAHYIIKYDETISRQQDNISQAK